MIANGIYACCDDNRKAAVFGNPTLNGIDYLEVVDHDAIALAIPRQQTLLVHCLNVLPADLAPANILITGGESITSIGVQWVATPPAPPPEATRARRLGNRLFRRSARRSQSPRRSRQRSRRLLSLHAAPGERRRSGRRRPSSS